MACEIAHCAAYLAVACPEATLGLCIDTIIALAAVDLVGAITSLQTIVSNTTNQDVIVRTLDPLIFNYSVQLTHAVIETCHNPAAADVSDAACVAMLRLLAVVAQRGPGTAIAGSALQPIILPLFEVAGINWDRDIAEASVELSSHVLLASLQEACDASPTIATSMLHFLMTGACGGHPPYMLPIIADKIYNAWLSSIASPAFFASAFRLAMAQPTPLPGGGAPWASWTEEAVQRTISELLSDANRTDAKRFKRLFKVLCGGKKKGAEGRPPPKGKH